MNRREFLKKSALATAGTMLVPSFLRALGSDFHPAPLARNLVIVQFSGGNDGLNTIIPYRNDIYHKLRPRLGIREKDVIPLNDELGLHPALEPLRKCYDEGCLAIINNVGYPNPDRSHFRSMDIWHTASDADEYLDTGWLGRYMDQYCEGSAGPHGVIETDASLSLACKGEQLKGIALQDPELLYKTTHDPFFSRLAEMDHGHLHPQAQYLYKTMAETMSSADYIREKFNTVQPAEFYPLHPFGKNMGTIARFIASGLETKVYYTSHNGFDTHINQGWQHQRLLNQFSQTMDVFIRDLKKRDKWKDTLVMVFSEFGRRVKQNASGGTDHGTANVVLMMGGSLKNAGMINQGPDLNDLDEGDLKYRVDFRQIYGEILDYWLRAESGKILSRKFTPLGVV